MRFWWKSGKICKNNNHTCFVHCVTLVRSLATLYSNSFLGTREIIMHEKTV